MYWRVGLETCYVLLGKFICLMRKHSLRKEGTKMNKRLDIYELLESNDLGSRVILCFGLDLYFISRKSYLKVKNGL